MSKIILLNITKITKTITLPLSNLLMGNCLKKTQSKNRIPYSLRESVWIKYNGNKLKGVCYSCGRKINKNDKWHCSHVISYAKGGKNVIDNLRPCCQYCNLSMGNQNLYTFIKERNLKGPGSNNIKFYFRKHPSQINDKRTNNWKRK